MADLTALAARAAELGHSCEVTRRDFPQYDAPPKFYVRCICGYTAVTRRTEKTAVEAVVFHLGKAVGEVDGVNGFAYVRRVDNGVSAAAVRNVASA